MSRKPHNRRARLERACRSLLRANYVAVVNIDPSGWQGMVNWKSGKRIAAGQALADAICDVPHRWSIYLAALCIDQNGQRFMKSAEAAPDGIYLAEHLTDVIEACYRDLCSTCNPQHLVASGWIAIPNTVSLTEAQADRIFDLVGAWPDHPSKTATSQTDPSLSDARPDQRHQQYPTPHTYAADAAR